MNPLRAPGDLLESVEVVQVALLAWVATFPDFLIEVITSRFARSTAAGNRTISRRLSSLVLAMKPADHVIIPLLESCSRRGSCQGRDPSACLRLLTLRAYKSRERK